MNRIIKILTLLLCVTMMPMALSAKARFRKAAKTAGVPHVVLTPQQTQEFDSLYFEALSLQLQDKKREAIRLVSEALAIDSLSAPARYLRSKLMIAQLEQVVAADRGKLLTKCLQDIEVAVMVDSTNYWYNEMLGRFYKGVGRYEKAIPCMERLVRLYPLKSDALYPLADLYMRVDSADLCLNVLNRIEELDGVNPNLTLQKFYLLSEQKRTDEAFNEYKKLIERFPYDMSYRLQLGDLQMKAGLIEQAKHTYDEAARIDPDNAYLWVAQSNYCSITGNQHAADSLVHNALINVNLDIDTKINILIEYLKTTLTKVQKEKDLAADTTAINLPGVDSLFQTVSAMHPTAAEVYDLHADYLSAIGQDSAARVQMRFAVDLKPSEEKYWGKILSYAAQCDDFDAVMKLAAEARQRHPQLLEVYLTTAYAYQRRNMLDSALVAYSDALSSSVQAREVAVLSRIYGLMGDVCHEKGDKEQCYQYYDMALKYNANNIMVLNNYAYFLCLDGGDLMKAEGMAAKVVQKFPDEPTYLDTYAWIYYLQGNYTLAKFYQQRAMDKSGDHPSKELVEHYEAIMKALNESTTEQSDKK